MRHYISCAEIANDFKIDRKNVHSVISLKAFRELLISKRDRIISPRAYDSRIFIDTHNNIYFYNGVTTEEVDELLTMLRKTAVAV